MLEQVEIKIQELKKLQTDQYYKKKDEDLADWGLVEKNSEGKVVPLIITDEEYEELIKASNGVVGVSSRNSVSKLLNVFSVAIIAIGCIAGFAAMMLADTLGGLYFSICIIGSGIFGLVFKGLAETIKLLQQIIDTKPSEKPDEKMAEEYRAKRNPQPQPQPQYQYAQPQPQYQVTYTTAAPPPFVQVTPPQYPYPQAPQYQPQPQPQPYSPQYSQGQPPQNMR